MTGGEDCVRTLAVLAGVPAGRDGVDYDWPTIEASVGLRLPADYKRLAQELPPGWFRRFARTLLPTAAGQFLSPDVAGQLDVMREWRSGGHGLFPYPIFPEPGGLLPWGQAVGGALLFWLTRGDDPERWPVIIATAQWDHWDSFGGTVCEFLTDVATGRYDASAFTEGPIRREIIPGGTSRSASPIALAGREPIFTPDPQRAAAPPSAGTRPDFWRVRLDQLGAGRSPVNEFAELAEVLGPAVPGRVAEDWDEVHARLGFALPSDYRAFADAYGAGTFGDVSIAVPGGPGDLDLFALLERKAAQVRGVPRRETDAPVYPEPGGTVFWGETSDGHTCGWAPVGADPDRWNVVLIRPSRELNAFKLRPGISFSTALKEYRLLHEQHPGLSLGLLPPRAPDAGAVAFSRATV